ncbi:armadillo-type protein, partial [Mycena olivaceomarginata]
MASWVPQQQGLQEVLQTLHESTDMNVAVQRAITQASPFVRSRKLNNFTRAPEYIAYLAYILTAMPQEEDRIRTIAGYLLKNNARLILTASPEVGVYVKAAVLQAFTDESIMIRNAAGQDIVAFLGQLEPRNWPECLQQLMNTLDSTDLDRQEVCGAGRLQCPRKGEDYPRKMDVEINGTRPLDFMIPKFLMLAEHSSAKMRSHAIACLSYFVPVGSQSLFVHLDNFIATLFKLASDNDPSVRRHVCQALVLLLAARPEKLMPEMANVAEYMLYSTKDKNENVALEACEFWLTFAEDADLAMHLHPLLGKVAPVLLDCMIYGEDDLLWLEGDAEDAAVPDKETDIKPRHYGGGKSHGLERDADGNPAAPKTRVGAYGEETIDSDEEDDYDLDDEDFADEMSTEWNLRKCAAAALDVLAVRFGGDLLNVLLGPLKEKLEPGLAPAGERHFGVGRDGRRVHRGDRASSDHPRSVSHQHPLGPQGNGFTKFAPRTLHHLLDARALCELDDAADLEEHKNQYFVPTMEGLLRMVLDNNKRVQEAGCSAFATLEEDAGLELAPYLEP